MSYREIAAEPGVIRVLAAQLLARFPHGMYSLAVLIHIEAHHGSYGVAGLVLAAMSVGQAVAGPLTSRFLGRWGTRRVLIITTLVSSAAVAALALYPSSVPIAMMFAALAGLSMPPVVPAVRTLYPRLVRDRLLSSLFSLDAMLQEVIWIIGPLVATIGTGLVGSTNVLLIAAVVQIIGCAWFIASPELARLVIPPARKGFGRVLGTPSVALIVVTGFLLIGAFAAMEAGVIANYDHGDWRAGLVLAICSIGSIVGGVILGHRAITRLSLAFRIFIVALGVAAAIALQDVVGLSIALFLAGIGTAPALAAMSTIIAGSVKFSATAEAYGWVGTGQLIGAALGSAIAGFFIDGFGSAAAMVVATVLAVAAAAIAFLFRGVQPDLSRGAEPPPETMPIERPI